jgi:hypothetical protein
VTLTFTTQKNAVRGEVIGLGLRGDPFICLVRSTASRVRHLLHNVQQYNTILGLGNPVWEPLLIIRLHLSVHPIRLFFQPAVT